MGDHVAFAGQPDLHTAAHEAARASGPWPPAVGGVVLARRSFDSGCLLGLRFS
jgi:hypothetical protein